MHYIAFWGPKLQPWGGPKPPSTGHAYHAQTLRPKTRPKRATNSPNLSPSFLTTVCWVI